MSRRTAILDRLSSGELLVHEWLTASRSHPSRSAYVLSTIDEGPGQFGIHGMIARLDRAAGLGSTLVTERRRLTRAKCDALFLYHLAEYVEEEASDFAAPMIPQLAFLSLARDIYWDAAASAVHPFTTPFKAEAGTPDLLAWVKAVRSILDDIDVRDRARADIESRFFRGRPLLFGDTADSWQRLRWFDAQMTDDFRTIPPKQRAARNEALAPADPEVVRRRVEGRVRSLIDHARVDGLRYLGMHQKADEIVTRHIREIEPRNLATS